MGGSGMFASRPGACTSPVYALEQSLAAGRDGRFSFDGAALSFRELDEQSNRFANLLALLGVTPGDRVLGMLDNSAEVLISWLGTSKVGAIWVPTNTSYRGEWLRWQVQDCEPAVIIAAARFTDLFDELRPDPLAEQCAALWVRGQGDRQEVPAGWLDYLDYHSAPAAPPAYRPRPADISHLIYTSGTTGRSKGCIVSHNYLCNQGRLGLLNLRRAPDDVCYTPLPLFHTAATELAVATLLSGGRAHFAARFSASRFWDEILRSGARAALLLGSMFAVIGNAPDSPAMQAVHGQLHSVAGGPFPPELQDVWHQRFGVTVTRGGTLGMTEAHYISSTINCDERPGSCGKPTVDTYDLRIVDPDDEELPRGAVGQIVVRPRAPHVMFEGYWRNSQATMRAMSNLWFHTGDFGYLDEDGYLFFSDRGNDRLRRGGENISSYELERALAHPDILELAAHAVPSELAEDEVKVVAVLKDGSQLSAEAFCRWAMGRVPRFAVPRFVEFRAELPKNPMGKVLKSQLREEGLTPATWDRVAAGVEIPR